ncbi:hypothetical protein [Streptomyces sp. Wb2n-11]|uniref:hypothetical protein n=1 Tax=Streptomyces sp. Wb2n-11 TaxID=1030533 RepID=UPI000AE89D35|nr:hypothetical protein [Streptomyces sp. Wb2n-11]
MNDFQPYSYTDSVTADRPWLASLVGVQDTNTITLDLSKFVAGTHYTVSANPMLQGRNVMRSGIPLGKVTASACTRRTPARHPKSRPSPSPVRPPAAPTR